MVFWHEGQAAQVETKNSIRQLCELLLLLRGEHTILSDLQYCPILCSSGKAAQP